jgi:hypothetical protein
LFAGRRVDEFYGDFTPEDCFYWIRGYGGVTAGIPPSGTSYIGKEAPLRGRVSGENIAEGKTTSVLLIVVW